MCIRDRVGTKNNSTKHWKAIGELIEFQEEAAEVLRYLGAHYKFEEMSKSDPKAARTVTTSMSNYLKELVERFQKEYGQPLRRVSTPYPPEVKWSPDRDERGRFANTAASYVASGLFVSLVCRGDLAVAIQRMGSNVSRWTVADDERLIRFMSYVNSATDVELQGKLGPQDLEPLAIHAWPDADWNGCADNTRSTSGLFLELVGAEKDHRLPVLWKASFQTFTSSSSAESETVSASVALRGSAIPVQPLLEAMLGKEVPIVCHIDNTQAISAITKGYSKKLKCLSRTHRCSIGVMNELYLDERYKITIVHTPSAEHLGDFFTKELGANVFEPSRDRLGLRTPS